MTSEKLTEALKTGKLTAEDIAEIKEKIDSEKLIGIIEKAKNPDEAIKAIAKAYPSVKAEELKKQFDFYADQMQQNTGAKKSSKKPMALTEEELGYVAGGSAVGDWFAKNWKGLLVGIAACAIFTGGIFGGAFIAGGASMAGHFMGIGGAIFAGGIAAGIGAGILTQGYVFDKQND